MRGDDKVRVLMFGWEFPPFNSGGLGTACYGLSKSLSQEVDITFVLPRKMDIQCDFMRIIYAPDILSWSARSSQELITYTTSELYSMYKKYQYSHFYSLLQEVEYYGMVAKRIAKQEDFDLIHAHDWLSFLAGINAHMVSGKPLIVQIHSTEFDRTGNTRGNYDVFTIEKAGMEAADSVIAVSNFTKNMITEQYGIPSSKIHVVHNGIDIPKNLHLEHEVLELKKKNKIILFVGRLTLQKGPDYFLKAAKKVLAYDPHVSFLVVGDGDMKQQLIREAIHLGISEKVIFTGFLRDEQLQNVYKSADLFVMPSVSEPFGITGLESAINGTPVLISKQSGVSEVLTHALKVDFWDIDEMTNKILAVLRHPPLKRTLKKNTLIESHLHTWHKAAKKVKKLYTSILKKRS